MTGQELIDLIIATGAEDLKVYAKLSKSECKEKRVTGVDLPVENDGDRILRIIYA